MENVHCLSGYLCALFFMFMLMCHICVSYVFVICISIFIFFLIHPLHIHAKASVLPVSLVDSVTVKVGNEEKNYQPPLCNLTRILYTCYTHCMYNLHTFYTHFVYFLHMFYQFFSHFLDMFRTCSKKDLGLKNKVFPESVGDLWAIIWHHWRCLRRGGKIFKTCSLSKK